jgi:iron complex transport system permease protein
VRARRTVTLVVLGVALVVALILAVGIGAVAVSPRSLMRMIAHAAGLRSVPAPDPRDVSIIVFLRLPRALAAVLVGGTLAACGVVMQGLFRNPMASSEVLGVSAGGSLGAVIAISTGLVGLSLLALPALTVVGALASAGLIYVLSTRRGSTSLLYIVIAGMAISSFFNGMTSALLLFAQQYQMSQYLFWTMGGLDGRGWKHILYSAPILVPGVAALSLFARDLDLFSMGEEGAQALGMNVERTKRFLLALSAVLTGVAISVSGPIGFIGLLVPHFFRLVVGADHRVLLPASALGGALFLVVCDLLGRSIVPPLEIRVGIITAILGSPYLLSLIVRTQRRGPRAA